MRETMSETMRGKFIVTHTAGERQTNTAARQPKKGPSDKEGECSVEGGKELERIVFTAGLGWPYKRHIANYGAISHAVRSMLEGNNCHGGLRQPQQGCENNPLIARDTVTLL